MRRTVTGRLVCCLLFSVCLAAAVVRGKVTDPSGAPIPGAQVSVISRVGVEEQTTTAADGAFTLDAAVSPGEKIVVTAPGFRTETVAPAAGLSIQLALAPQVESVRVAGSSLDVATSQQGTTASLIPGTEIRQRNEPFALDLLRYLPGMILNQSGAPGGVASLFQRGGYADFTLVQIDGVPVNSFGGAFDFSGIPSAALDHIEVASGPQSAVYGPYSNSGAVNFVTRQPGAEPELDLLAEGGTYQENRFAATASGTLAGFGLALSAGRYFDNGPVANSDYGNDYVLLDASRRFGRQSLGFGGYFDSNDAGEPGPWGSDPKHTFTGIDTISRSKNNVTASWLHYTADLAPRLREEVFGSFFLNNNGFVSPYGFSFNKDLRWQGEARTIASLTTHDTLAFGISAGREEVRNTFITDAASALFPIPRDDFALYAEDHYEFRGRLFLNAGIRGEFLLSPSIPPDGFSRPFFPASSIAAANPKIAAAYLLAPRTRVHSSFGTGIRPPSGFELAFTNNPALKPERTRSADAGLEQKLLNDRLLLDATYFYNRYYDLIVTLGGSLAALSHYQSANLANSRSEGAEFSASLRPARWIFLRGSYMHLDTGILSLDGSEGLAPQPFQVGQQLLRCPPDSGSFVAEFTRGRIAADITGYIRGQDLDVEPSYGATNGLFFNSGFTDIGINLNYRLGHGVVAYGNLRNALNQQYEEVFGYPSPRLNFVAGMKWTITREKP